MRVPKGSYEEGGRTPCGDLLAGPGDEAATARPLAGGEGHGEAGARQGQRPTRMVVVA